jgi:hypothetical protein
VAAKYRHQAEGAYRPKQAARPTGQRLDLDDTIDGSDALAKTDRVEWW